MATYPQGVVRDPVDGTYYYKGQAFAFSPEVEAKYSEAENVQLYVDFVDRQEDLGILDTPDPERQARYEQLLNQEQFDRSLPAESATDSVINNTSPAEVEAGTEELTETEEQTVDENLDAIDEEGVEPEVSDKAEPEATSEEGIDSLSTSVISVTAQRPSSPDSVDLSKALSNELLQNASYTYGLSLALMTADEYNKVVKDGEYIPNRVLIASAGRYNNTPGPNQFMRSPYFKEDFYFEGLELKTVIGLNAQSRNSNAVQYKFTLIEPYGFTLLDRIITLCNDPEIDCNNYLDMPYMLQIDFFGIGDDGAIKGVIPNTTKRIPIRLNTMQTSITERGTEYTVEGVPYNHSAFDITTVTTPANFEVKATTVSQFFTSIERGEQETKDSERESASNALYKTTSGKLAQNGQYINPNELNTSLLSQQTKIDVGLITSYGTALNNWHRSAYNAGKIGVNDIYKFQFNDPEIANSPFVTGELSSPKDTGMADITRANSIKRSNLGSNTSDYDPNLKIFQVNAGTYLDRVISWVIRNSKWMQDQIVIPDGEDPESYLQKKAANRDKPLYWFKVTASIRLIKFDKVRKIWAREITYHVNKYEVRNVKLDVAPQGRVRYPVKAYNYIYTGKNDDIIDVDIKFNALYYNALTLYRNQLTKVNPIANNNEEKDKDNPKNYRGAVQDPNAIMPLVMKPQTLDARERASGGSVTAKQVAVADLEASLMTMSQADMLNVELKILGDPAYIKQDELFWTAALAGQRGESEDETDPRLTYDGSLKMDNGEVYVSLVFRTPIDRDEESGLMKFDGKMELSLFSGLYRVLTVNSVFRQGQFIQTLSLIRLTNQEQLDYAQNKITTSDNRNSVPGDQAILDEYLQGPDYTTPDTPESEEQLDDGTSAQEDTDLETTEAEEEVDPNQQDLEEINDTAEETPISNENEPTSEVPPPEPVTPVTLPDGVTQDRFGSYQYKGLTVPAGVEPGSAEFNQTITAIDNKQTIQVQAINPSNGQRELREFNGDWNASNLARAENNVEFAESELKRFDQKVESGFFDRDGRGISAETQAKLDAARERYVADVAAAKSTLTQAKQGEVVLAPQ